MSRRLPVSRVEVIERSLRCFVLGLLALVPVLGVPLAVEALFEFWRVRREGGPDWNPASRYLVAGERLAILGLLETFLWVLVIAAGALAQPGL
jgi:hypothetical protein